MVVSKMYALLLVLFVVEASSSKLPPTFKRCLRKQPDFKECFASSVHDVLSQLTAPIKEVGLPNLEPLEIPALSISAGDGPVAFQQDYKNIKMHGITKVHCPRIDLDFDKNLLEIECTNQEIPIDFEYDYNGKFLFLPFVGKGPGNVRLLNPKMLLRMKVEQFDKHGQKYLKIVDSQLKFHPERMIFKLQGLFSQDEALSNGINKVINDNWDVFWENTGTDYEEFTAKVFASIINHFFSKVPIVELFGEP